MPKSFEQAFQEWKDDKSYIIGEDIGAEYYDELECPTHSESSSAKKKNGTQATVKTILSCRETPEPRLFGAGRNCVEY